MKRFVYSPKVQAYVKLDSADRGFRTIDLTNDLVRGTVTRRLDQISSVNITLQNKGGKYTKMASEGVIQPVSQSGGNALDRIQNLSDNPSTVPPEFVQIRPMDRIIVLLSRVGEPFLVFSGYVDTAPYFQLYPGPVTLTASCPLKLLQHTYFDPGLLFMQQFFRSLGWDYDPGSGMLWQPGGPATGAGRLGNYDIGGGIADVIREVLLQIGGWQGEIDILKLPNDFLLALEDVFTQEMTQEAAEQERVFERLFNLFNIGSISTDNTGAGTGDYANPAHGSVPPETAARHILNAGFVGEVAVTALAIAWAESTLIADNVGYNDESVGVSGGDYYGTYDLGLFQINSRNLDDSLHHLPKGPANKKFGEEIEHLPASQQAIMKAMFDPAVNAKKAYEIYTGWSNTFNAWSTYKNSLHLRHMDDARIAINKAKVDRKRVSNAKGTTTVPGTDAVPVTVSTKKSVKTPVSRKKPKKLAFLYPIQAVPGFSHNVTPQGTFGNNRGDHLHAGNDIAANEGVALVACVDGEIAVNTTQSGIGGGHYVILKESGSSRCYTYMHMMRPSHLSVGAKVKQGQVIGHVGHSGTSSGFNHLHFEIHPFGVSYGYDTAVDPKPVLDKAWASGNKTTDVDDIIYDGASAGVGLGLNSGVGQAITTGEDVRQIALQTGWFQMQLQTNDSNLSETLVGPRALANDIRLLEWISQMVKASGRSFMTLPDGSFFAFHPDYFGYYNHTPYFQVRDIEILDLTIDRNDTNLATHVFATGPLSAYNGIQEWDRTMPTVASVESKAFDRFINVGTEDPTLPRDDQFDIGTFLQKYGARPFSFDVPDVNNPHLLWMSAWMEFTKKWAEQFQTVASLTFMPELLPGGLVDFGGRITLFIEEIQHIFDFENGFLTEATLTAPAAVNAERFKELPSGGTLKENEPFVIEDLNELDTVIRLGKSKPIEAPKRA